VNLFPVNRKYGGRLSALHAAVISGFPEIGVTLLLEAGDVPGNNGTPVVVMTAECGHFDIVNILQNHLMKHPSTRIPPPPPIPAIYPAMNTRQRLSSYYECDKC
jgi:hypothetical protein